MQTGTYPTGYKNTSIHKGSGTATLRQLSPRFINAKPQNKTKSKQPFSGNGLRVNECGLSL